MLPGEPYEIIGAFGDFESDLAKNPGASEDLPRMRRSRPTPMEFSGHGGLDYKLVIVRHAIAFVVSRISLLPLKDFPRSRFWGTLTKMPPICVFRDYCSSDSAKMPRMRHDVTVAHI